MFMRYFIALICLSLIASTHAANWTQYRGPQASGVDKSKQLPVEWNVEGGKNVRWQTPMPGLGHASPIIFGDRVYIATAVGASDKELKVGLYGDIAPIEEKGSYQWRLLSVDRNSGKIIWNVLGNEAVPRVKRHPKATHCNSTPATDGKRIVTFFGSEGLFCFDMDGKLVWKKDLGPMDSGFYVVPSAQWGFASSPVIHDGKVIALVDVQTNSFIAAFNLADGKELWRTPRKDVPTWGCPAIVQSDKRTQIVVNGWHHTAGYDFADGKEVWHLDGGGDIPVPTPIAADGLIYLTSGHGRENPMRAVRADATGNITPETPASTNAGIAWVQPRQGTYMQTPIAIGNRLYACKDFGVVVCFDSQTGKVIYNERIKGPAQGYTASPVSDGKHLYFPGETGKVIVVPVGDEFSVAATNDLKDNCMATPAIADGTIFFRTQSKLIAVGSK